jgi:beta-galactosidase
MKHKTGFRWGNWPLALAIAAAAILPRAAAAERTRESFDPGWRFARFGPMPDGSQRAEPATEKVMAAPKFDDASWRALDLPQDWGVESGFRADLPNNTGKLPWAGIGWYRKPLFLPAADSGRRVFLDFDGAMSHPKIFVNGQLAGQWAYGYSSFRVEITDFVRFGATNTIAVRLDNPPNSSRWYPGGGIYRHVWLVKTEPVHVAHWGVFVTTPKVSATNAEVVIQTAVDNQSAQPAEVTVENVLFAPNSETVVARVTTSSPAIAVRSNQVVSATMSVTNPALWDLATPRLYTLQTIVRVNGREMDRVATPFGIRHIEWSADRGFLLNGRIVKLNGVCDHSDLGPLGTAVNTRGLQRQLELLQEMGCNAIRTSHNPPAPELLELCDRMGFLVLDEAFDCWQQGKTANDYHLDFPAWHERDVVNLVHRDRNHPCVIAWSCGNEIREQGDPAGADVARMLVALFHREDPTRLVTAACNNARAGQNGFSEALDIMGFNYKPQVYASFHQRYPQQPAFGSETASCVSSRGEYFFPVSWDKARGFFNFQVSSYDLYAPGWAMRPEIEWAGQDQNPYIAGEFVWTGFDYLGEPTPYNQDKSNALNFSDPAERKKAMALFEKLGGKSPARSSYFGIFDLCGFKKDRFYLYQSRWRPDLPMAHILPHWNWPDRVGQITPIHVYTSGDAAELFLNGQSLGRKQKGANEYRLHWDDVKYAPGELKVIAYKNGQRWAEDVVRTTGPAVALKLVPDRATLKADGNDLSYVTVEVVDAKGQMVPTANQHIRFSVAGPARLAAVDNGDATSQLPFQGSEMNAFNGKCLVVLRSVAARSGEIVLRAQAGGLPGATISMTSKAN